MSITCLSEASFGGGPERAIQVLGLELQ